MSEILCEGERATGSTGIRPVFDARFQITDPRFPLIPNQGYLPEPFTALETLGERTARRVLYSNAVELGSEEREKEKEVGEEVHDPNGYLARERIEELQREAERAYLVRQLRSARRRESTATGGRVRPLLQRVIYEVLAPLRIFKRKKRG